MAINTAPNRNPPESRCCITVASVEPVRRPIQAITTPPATALNMMRKLPMPLQSKIAAPKRMQNLEVSPTEPGMNPQNSSDTVGRLSA